MFDVKTMMDNFSKGWEVSLNSWKDFTENYTKSMDAWFNQMRTMQNEYFKVMKDWMNSWSKWGMSWVNTVYNFNKAFWPSQTKEEKAKK